MTLSRDAILAAKDVTMEVVEIPEWGGSVNVRVMTAGDRDAFEAEVQGRGMERIRSRLAIRTVCDDAGQPLFTLEDEAKLSEKSAAALSRIFNVAARINHLLPDDVENLRKN